MTVRGCKQTAGFTLMEVVVAMMILAMSLTVLLQAQVSSLNNAGKARDMTIATVLARSKMIDMEQKLFDEGFTMGEVNEEGDFGEEGHPDYKWKYRLSEIEIDLSMLTSMCGKFGGGDDAEAGGCESMLSGFGAPLETLMTQIGKSLRLGELTVSWNSGKYDGSMTVRALMSRDDMALTPEGAATDATGGTGTQPDAARGTGLDTGGTNLFGSPKGNQSSGTRKGR